MIKRASKQFINIFSKIWKILSLIIWVKEVSTKNFPPTILFRKTEWIFSLYKYRNSEIKNALWQIKYRGNRKLADFFGQRLAEQISETILEKYSGVEFKKQIILVPVPIHWRRRLERGFNQSEWLGEAVYKNLKLLSVKWTPDKPRISYQKVLRRKIYTKKQSWNSRSGRFKSTQNVFALETRTWARIKNDLENITFIIIDDIVTTGATLKETRRPLIEAGAVSVIAFAIGY